MPEIKKVTPLTENPHVNLYHLDVESKTGRKGHYYVASRAKTENDLKIKTRKTPPTESLSTAFTGRRKTGSYWCVSTGTPSTAISMNFRQAW